MKIEKMGRKEGGKEEGMIVKEGRKAEGKGRNEGKYDDIREGEKERCFPKKSYVIIDCLIVKKS